MDANATTKRFDARRVPCRRRTPGAQVPGHATERGTDPCDDDRGDRGAQEPGRRADPRGHVAPTGPAPAELPCTHRSLLARGGDGRSALDAPWSSGTRLAVARWRPSSPFSTPTWIIFHRRPPCSPP